MLLPASMVTICGAFLRPRMFPWLAIEIRHSGIRLEASRADAAGHQQRSAERPALGDMWDPATHHPDGGVADQADAVEQGARATGDGIGRSSSPPLDILHGNKDFAAVYKPPLMHVHRPEFGSKDEEFVMQKARNQLGRRIYLPHRLDRGTSGCLLVGFSPEAGKVLHRALANPTSTKTYAAIVRGSGEGYVGKGWFTVDRAIKDDKKVLREASTRFLFVRGGNAPDPRCCLVLAQPSTGRFHQIRRHLNGISHPVVGDSVHGSSRFNRELVSHPTNPAPAGRLLLHCLRLELPTLPNAGSPAWRAGAAAASDQQLGGGGRRRGDGSEKAPQAGEDNGEPRLHKVSGGDWFSDSDDGWTPRAESNEEALDSDKLRVSAASGGRLSRQDPQSPTSLSVVTQRGGAALSASPIATKKATGEVGGSDEAEWLKVEGLDVYAEPPDDMLAFLRGMSWWEEGMIQAAERIERNP